MAISITLTNEARFSLSLVFVSAGSPFSAVGWNQSLSRPKFSIVSTTDRAENSLFLSAGEIRSYDGPVPSLKSSRLFLTASTIDMVNYQLPTDFCQWFCGI